MYNRVRFLGVVILAILMLVGSTWPQGLGVSKAQTNLSEELLFADNFNDGNADGWTEEGSGQWAVVGGVYTLQIPQSNAEGISSAGDSRWQDYTFEVDAVTYQGEDRCIYFRYQSLANRYSVDIRNGYGDLTLSKHLDGVWHPLRVVPFSGANNQWCHEKIEVQGNRIRVWVDGRLYLTYTDTDHPLQQGKVALGAWSGSRPQWRGAFDNVEVRGLEPPVGLSITYLDAVQVVDGQDIPLVKGKDTAIKVRVKNTGTAAAHNIRVTVTANGVSQGTVTRNRFYREERATQQTDFIFTGDPEDHLDVLNAGEEKTLYFFDDNGAFNPVGNENATSWYTVSATVTCDEGAEGATDTEQLTKEVVATKWGSDQTLRLAYFPADWQAFRFWFLWLGSRQEAVERSACVATDLKDAAARMLPIPKEKVERTTLKFEPSSWRYAICPPLRCELLRDGLGSWLASLRASVYENYQVLSGLSAIDRYVVIVPPNWFSSYALFSRDAAGIWSDRYPEFFIAEDVTNTKFPGKPKGSLATHELGHSWGLGIPEVTNLIRVTEGLDVSRRRLMKDGGGHKVIDLMYGGMDPLGGQADRWIKPSDYRFLLDHQRVRVTQSALSPRFREGAGILVRAVISETNQTTLEPWFLLEGDFEYFLGVPEGSEFWLEYLGGSGNVLYRKGMGDLFEFMGERMPYAPICFVAPYVENTQVVALKRGSQLLAKRVISANSPSITFTSPVEGEEINGQATIRWQASDQDRDDLFFTLTAYQEEADQSIWPLASEVSRTNEYVWDTRVMPEGWYRLRILVTDGFNTTKAWTRVHVVHRIHLPLLFKTRQTQPPTPTPTSTPTLTPTPRPTATPSMGRANIWGQCLQDGQPRGGVMMRIGSEDGQSTWPPTVTTNNEGYFRFVDVQVPPGGTTYGLWPEGHNYCRKTAHVRDGDFIGPIIFNFNASGQCY